MISKEQYFISNVLFSKGRILKKELINIDYEKVIKIASSHLIIPAFYYNCKKKSILKYLPKDFKDYIKQIYLINKSRNKQLKKEVIELSRILQENKIEHVFLKGTACLFSGNYNDLGERMIGDIDFLFQKEDRLKLLKILKNNGYYGISKYDKYGFDGITTFQIHIPRKIKKNRIFAIEPHFKLIDKKFFESKKVLKSKKKINGIYVPSLKNQLLHIIYNFQINDKGSIRLSYSLRSHYDYFKLSNIKINEKNKHIDRFIHIYKSINLITDKDESPQLNIIDRFRIYFTNNYKIYRVILTCFAEIKISLNWRLIQLIEICSNKKYRKYIYNKFFNA